MLARRVRSQPDHFFGGLFIVLQFDLGQLHPVKCRCDSCKAFEHGGYDDDEDPIRTPLYNSDWWEGFLHNCQNSPLCVCVSATNGGLEAVLPCGASSMPYDPKVPLHYRKKTTCCWRRISLQTGLVPPVYPHQFTCVHGMIWWARAQQPYPSLPLLFFSS